MDNLKKLGYRYLDHNYVDIYDLDYRFSFNQNVIKINKDNFDIFKAIHQKYENNMYYNNHNIYNTLDNWIILVYKDSAIYSMIYDEVGEIFGIDSVDYDIKDLITSMISLLNNNQKLYFFSDERSHNIIFDIGFKTIIEAYYYSIKI